ncbi:MAG: CbiX/SirB N-terminal domain-containing protein [Armatimonas sp.]
MTALVLFSHGSLLCGSGEALEGHAARLRKLGSWDRVEIGYLNYSEPLLAETVEMLVTDGVEHIHILPYFLAPGYFVQHALPNALEPLRERFPALRFTVAPAIGHDSRLADALLAAASEARESPAWREPLQRAGASCRNRSDCPLYNTPACPHGQQI